MNVKPQKIAQAYLGSHFPTINAFLHDQLIQVIILLGTARTPSTLNLLRNYPYGLFTHTETDTGTGSSHGGNSLDCVLWLQLHYAGSSHCTQMGTDLCP